MDADMDLRAADASESRFSAYVEGLVSAIGRADRAGPRRDYCAGLMMPCERGAAGVAFITTLRCASRNSLSCPRQRSRPGDIVMWRGLSRLSDIELGALSGAKFVGKCKNRRRRMLRP
jgi:hypothetical protein